MRSFSICECAVPDLESAKFNLNVNLRIATEQSVGNDDIIRIHKVEGLAARALRIIVDNLDVFAEVNIAELTGAQDGILGGYHSTHFCFSAEPPGTVSQNRCPCRNDYTFRIFC